MSDYGCVVCAGRMLEPGANSICERHLEEISKKGVPGIPLWTIEELESQCEDWVDKLNLVEPAKSMLRVKLKEACNWIEKNVRAFNL